MKANCRYLKQTRTYLMFGFFILNKHPTHPCAVPSRGTQRVSSEGPAVLVSVQLWVQLSSFPSPPGQRPEHRSTSYCFLKIPTCSTYLDLNAVQTKYKRTTPTYTTIMKRENWHFECSSWCKPHDTFWLSLLYLCTEGHFALWHAQR